MALTKVKPTQIEGTSPTLTGAEVLTNKDLTSGTNTFPSSLQPTLVSGSNIKTINGLSVVGAGDISTPFGFRNRIFNGDMRIDQKNSGALSTVNSTANFTVVDQLQGFGQTTDGVFTAQQVVDAPAGFKFSAKATITTADASIGSTQSYGFQYKIEGQNIIDFAFGTASAKTITLSFWVKSSLTGTFGGGFSNSASTRGYAFTFVINAANTWEYKTVTIAGDTSGTWLTDTGIGLRIVFSFGAGTTYSATAGSWQASSVFGATGQVNLIATNTATFNVTGVQLELGSVATTFEFRPIGTELALCQRYLPITYAADTMNGMVMNATSLYVSAKFSVPARIAPTSFTTDGTWYATVPAVGQISMTIGFNTAGIGGGAIAGVASGMTTGQACWVYGNTATKILWLGSEL